MLSEYIKDLIDHKNRVAKYMCRAADELFAREVYGGTRIYEVNQYSTLIDFVHLLSYEKDENDLNVDGQIKNIATNTLTPLNKAAMNASRTYLIAHVASELFLRAAIHDNSKFSLEEFDIYETTFPILQRAAYGTDEYNTAVDMLGPAWKHHCEVNSHHPEHYENGISGMNAIDLTEMCCDWIAASERSQSDIIQSLEINKRRFGIDDQLHKLIENTVVDLLNG